MAKNVSTKDFYISQLQDPESNPYGTIQFFIQEKTVLGNKTDVRTGASEDSFNLVFAIMNEVSFGLSSTWENAIGDIAGFDSMQSKITSGAAAIANAAQNAGYENVASAARGVANTRFKPLSATYLSWVNSGIADFKFDLFRFALTPEEDTLAPFKTLSRMVLPSYWMSGMMKSPGGYAPPFAQDIIQDFTQLGTDFMSIFTRLQNQESKDGERKVTEDYIAGTVAVQIGTWCTIRNLLVTDLSFTPSKACTRYGNPLYTRGSISLKPYRMLLYDDVLQMFTARTTSTDDNAVFRQAINANKYNATDYIPSLFGGNDNKVRKQT